MCSSGIALLSAEIFIHFFEKAIAGAFGLR
jgi:hypothetical protein